MRICFLIGNLNLSGGTERVTTLVANALAERQHTVHVLNLYEGQSPFFELNSNILNHALSKKKLSLKMHALPTILKIRQFVQTHHIEHFVVVDSISCVVTVPALIGLNVQHICWEHFNFNIDLGVKLRRWGRWLASRYCHDIVTLTQYDQHLWQKGLPSMRANLHVIANPCTFAVQSNQMTLQQKRVLAVGRLQVEKGFDLLLQAWKQVIAVHPQWKLTIVGSGQEEQALKQQAQDLALVDNIEFIPKTADVLHSYQQASIYCLSSRFEGFGMVLLEAMACGLPIVAFDCPVGPHEILKNTQNTLVKAEDSQALAVALQQMIQLDEPQYQAISESNKRFVQSYHIQSIANLWEQLLSRPQ